MYLDKLAQRTDERGAETLLDIASCAEDGASGSAASLTQHPSAEGVWWGVGWDSARSTVQSASTQRVAIITQFVDAFGSPGSSEPLVESLILAQDQRWRRA